MCFLQFLTSQGDILKLIYVGVGGNAKVCKFVGCCRFIKESSRLVWGTKVSGPSSWYMKVSSGCHCLCSSLRLFALKSERVTLRCTLEYEEHV